MTIGPQYETSNLKKWAFVKYARAPLAPCECLGFTGNPFGLQRRANQLRTTSRHMIRVGTVAAGKATS
jgi:hypothetical protein